MPERTGEGPRRWGCDSDLGWSPWGETPSNLMKNPNFWLTAKAVSPGLGSATSGAGCRCRAKEASAPKQRGEAEKNGTKLADLGRCSGESTALCRVCQV